jgi:hypothetical protein
MTSTTGRIPDFSSAPLYATVVMNTRDDPRLLALWCHYAIWNPIDDALGQQPDAATWAERTLLAPAVITMLTKTLIARGLLTAQGDIGWWSLQEASWQAVLPFSNELRRRAGIAPLQATQESLFPTAKEDAL